MRGEPADAPMERIRRHLVDLRMPRALETLDQLVQQLERGQLTAIEVIDLEEITIRESRRVKAALQMARLTPIKTLSGFDFSFQPSLDRSRIMALAGLDFIDRHEVVHFIGQSGTGKSHLAAALRVKAVRAGRSVYFSPLADILDSLGNILYAKSTCCIPATPETIERRGRDIRCFCWVSAGGALIFAGRYAALQAVLSLDSHAAAIAALRATSLRVIRSHVGR